MCSDKTELIQRLCEWGKTTRKIAGKRKELQRIKSQLSDADLLPRGQNMDGMPHGGAAGDSIGRIVAAREKLAETANRLTEEILVAENSVTRMNAAVGMLPHEQEQLIILRYRDCKSLYTEIPDILSVSDKTAQRWHEMALDEIDREIKTKEPKS